MFVIVKKWLVPKKVVGITLWPFIVLRQLELKQNLTLIRHEKIHLRQQIELLILPFYIWYALEFLIRWAKLKNWDKAYRAISFEQEAYSNQDKPEYLKSRKFWAFLKYLVKNHS